jgi:pimeloyl-ACP methyl ester carboxylesterase
MPTTLIRGANSHFVNAEDAEMFARTAPGFRQTHIVADAAHSVQGDQPAAPVELLRGVLARRGRFRQGNAQLSVGVTTKPWGFVCAPS